MVSASITRTALFAPGSTKIPTATRSRSVQQGARLLNHPIVADHPGNSNQKFAIARAGPASFGKSAGGTGALPYADAWVQKSG